MKKILVPTDFSENAAKALLYAAEIASKTGAEINLLHVAEPLTNNIRQPYPLHEKLEHEIERNRMKQLDELQAWVAGTHPAVKATIHLLKGTVVTAVLDFTETHSVDLIVMGTRGASGLKEVFMGTVSAAIIGRARVPVFTIPAEYEAKEIDHMLFATNRFEKHAGLLTTITSIATLFSANLHIAVFLDTDTADASDFMYNTRELSHYLAFLKKSYPGVVCSGDLLEGKDFEQTVEGYQTGKGVDIIVMVTYPKSFWDRLLRKSVTKRMAFHSNTPLLALPGEFEK